jgi:hypothetical protein
VRSGELPQPGKTEALAAQECLKNQRKMERLHEACRSARLL